ncbi:MAG: hypothetical protein ACOYME_00850 [Prochlorotrichaceae cyanobacterium]|jgi:hypothetical protein
MTQSATIEQPVQDQNIQIQELAIVLGAKNFKPSLLNPDALTVAGIIPADWELARQPVLSAQVGQLSFKNGVNILAQGNTLTFSEGIRPGQEAQIPSIARQYVTKMTNADYRTVGISPKVLIGFSREEDTARKFIVEQLIAPGPWREIGTQPQAKVEFSYRLDRCFLNLSVVEARIAQEGKPTLPALLFNSNFAYNFPEGDANQAVQMSLQRIDLWAEDWKLFQEIIQQRFISHLGQSPSIFRN